jgi:hypothetical protein
MVAADLLAFMSCIEWKAIPQSLLGTLCGCSFVSRREGDSTKLVESMEEKNGTTCIDLCI